MIVRAMQYLLAAVLALILPVGSTVSAEVPPGAAPYRLEAVPAGGGSRFEIAAWQRDGVVFAAAEDLARVLGISYSWRPDAAKLTFHFAGRRLFVLEGTEFARVGDTAVLQLPAPPMMWEGRLLVPLQVVVDDRGDARPWVGQDLQFLSEDRLLAAAPFEDASLVDLDIVPDPLGWKLILTADRPLDPQVVRDEAASVLLILPRTEFDPILFPVPTEHPWFQGLRLRPIDRDLELSFAPARGAQGYRIESRARGSVLEIFLGLDERDLREGRIRPFRASAGWEQGEISRVVLDPGHGGTISRGRESRLAHVLAGLVAQELRDRLDVAAILTRGPDENPTPGERADRANRAGGDILISLHLHVRVGGPAAFVARAVDPPGLPPALAALGFRPFAGAQDDFLSWSRLLARCLLEGVSTRLEVAGGGVYDETLGELAAAAMPAVLLEIPTDEGGPTEKDLAAIADGIVEGIRLYLLSGREY